MEPHLPCAASPVSVPRRRASTDARRPAALHPSILLLLLLLLRFMTRLPPSLHAAAARARATVAAQSIDGAALLPPAALQAVDLRRERG